MEVVQTKYPNKFASLDVFPVIIAKGNELVSVTKLFNQSKLLSGVFYEAVNPNEGDYVQMELVDPNGKSIKGCNFVKKWYVFKGPTMLRLHSAKIPAGCGIKISYKNKGTTPAKMYINLELYDEGRVL